MRLGMPRLSLWSWRRKTFAISFGMLIVGLLLAALVVTAWQLEGITIRRWLSFTFVPFAFVVLIGAAARMQDKADLHSHREIPSRYDRG